MSTLGQTGSVNSTMGAFFLGVIFSMTLWGAASIQLYHYFSRFRGDDLRIKLLVGWVFALLTTHQALAVHSSYVYLITHYDDRPFLEIIVNGHLASMLVCGLVCISVQAFLIHRVWSLSHQNLTIASFLSLLSAGQLTSVIIFYSKATSRSTFSSLNEILWVSRSVNILSAIGDMSIAIILILLLLRSRTGFKRSESIIRQLIIMTFGTGLATSLCALLTLITSLAYPNSLIYLAFYLCDSPLYTNALLATLNARRSSTSIDIEKCRSTYSTSLSPLRSPGVETLRTKSFGDLCVKVDTNTETHIDVADVDETDNHAMRLAKGLGEDSKDLAEAKYRT